MQKENKLNPKKNFMERRKRNPLEVIGENIKRTVVSNPKTKKSYLVTSSTLKKVLPCKDCNIRNREDGSSRCAECSENHV